MTKWWAEEWEVSYGMTYTFGREPGDTLGSEMAQAFSRSDVRIDKVAALRRAIAAGKYRVSTDDLAQKLIRALTKQPV